MRELTAEPALVEPAEDKKFGTFLGVFTPSILTILGVIMYQRMGWVVGNAGLFWALVVVLTAHVISVTTGLSVASIATNRMVRTGGNYYIISRSLGLSIGGAIGLALYLALTLGVSLYLIGFAEAFVAASGFSFFADPKDDLRLIGSVACVGISMLTLYSTSIALKSQLFVLGCIVVSIVAIFLGKPIAPLPGELPVAMAPPAGATELKSVFAVFFPAVTGFTAGVGMSGDLKDPKRAIPVGTIAAIVVGLIIYIVLTVYLTRVASVQQLQNDYNVLLRIAFEPRLVTLGVFAATLSSALGSILGAPRTLQALAFDGIVPRVFARGRVEPRVALVATIVIAEAGILLGELELVGSILSMFFLTTYGFLCLACGLERWASPDFRPQFKVPIWVSLAGAVACFLVMYSISPFAMVGAVVVMGGLYAVLKRRQLALSSGDTWGGVWSAVVRLGLMRLSDSASKAHSRNWRPNMVAISRPGSREALISFARALVGDRGILTHFDLVPGESPRMRVDSELEAAYPGMFARKQGSSDPFESIPQLVANFGLAGMETNVVLIGWPRNAVSNRRYAEMVERLIKLDVSALMLRQDFERGFGKRERVDLWWDGEAPTGQLMLTLAHLLTTSQKWKGAKVRLLVNGRSGYDEGAAKRKLDRLIEGARIKVEGVLLAPLADERRLSDRVRQESGRSDLVIFHAVDETGDRDFVETNDLILSGLGTALLVRPSREFSEVETIFDRSDAEPPRPRTERALVDARTHPGLLPVVRPLLERVEQACARFDSTVQGPSLDEELRFIKSLEEGVEEIWQLPRRLSRRGGRREAARGFVDWAAARFGQEVLAVAERFVSEARAQKNEDRGWSDRLQRGLHQLKEDLRLAVAEVPQTTLLVTEAADWAARPGDRLGMRLKKVIVRGWMRLGGRRPFRRVPTRAWADYFLGPRIISGIEQHARALGQRRFDALARSRRLVRDVDRLFENLRAELDSSSDESLDRIKFGAAVTDELASMERVAAEVRVRFVEHNEEAARGMSDLLRSEARRASEALAEPMEKSGEVPPSAEPRGSRRAQARLDGVAGQWGMRHSALASALALDLQVAALATETRRTLYQVVHRVTREVGQGPLASLERARSTMERVAELRDKLESEQEQNSDPGDAAGDGSGAVANPAELKVAFLEASDHLRATWDDPYRPEPGVFVDQLLTGLGRAAERIPATLTTLDDAALAAAEEGRLERTSTSYPARRLVQAFLEENVIKTVREMLAPLPEHVQRAQNTLVDAVRLVAFELELAAGQAANEVGEESEEGLALGSMLQERTVALENAHQDLTSYLDLVRRHLLEDLPPKLEKARDAVVGATVVSPARVRAPKDLARGVQVAVRRLETRLTGVTRSWRGRSSPQEARSLTDELLRLKEVLSAPSEQHVSLPLVYRRVFGRAALETADLLCGRGRERDSLVRLIERWKTGAGGPVGILGEPRSGRSSLANVAARELASKRNVVRLVPPVGGTGSAEELNLAMVKAVVAREGQGAEGALRAMPPGAVILVDDLGRWIERTPDGMSALWLLVRLWRRLGDRHLFVVSATPYAWRYCEQLAGIEEVFLGIVRTGPLPPSALIEALELRQRTTGFELEFRRRRTLIFQSERNRQFEQLYARSRGNVGEAIEIWRHSVVGVTERKVVLAVGAEPDTSVLTRLPLRWQAGLGAVALHRAISAARLSRVLRIGRDQTAGLLSDLERAGLLVSDRSGTWSLDPTMQALVLRALYRQGVFA